MERIPCDKTVRVIQSSITHRLCIWAQVLGLTVLAWGNSIGDFSTNMAMARKGLANMALTACYAGPVFNLLVGCLFMSACLYKSASYLWDACTPHYAERLVSLDNVCHSAPHTHYAAGVRLCIHGYPDVVTYCRWVSLWDSSGCWPRRAYRR